jgi:3-methyladenine DNA glycosylase AlkC
MSKQEKKKFKDWFDREAVERLADQISGVWTEFDTTRFIRLASRDLSDMEMMARVRQFSDALASALPDDRIQALDILTRSLPPVMPDCEAVTDGWLQWPVGQFIADHGIDHPDAAFAAMIELTQRFSSEFAIRPFALRYPEDTFARLQALTSHPSPHVRRWCSEGVRPRLPWGGNLKPLMQDPSLLWPILEALKDDPELYVRRSVANNLNDIAKDHPDLVVTRCAAWFGISDETDWVVRHGLRSLIKDGHPEALALIGYSKPDGLKASLSVTPSSVAIGGFVQLQATLHNPTDKPLSLLIDYGVHYVRKQNRTSLKVFKWKTLELPPNESVILTKKHNFKLTSIRALYAGTHRMDLNINGHCMASADCILNG